MSNFDRRQLRYFVAVAEELHFSKAARRLHISQPPLSQQIAALERDLGVQLFKRTRRTVEITTAGQQFLRDARVILADMHKAATRARAAAAGQIGTLRIGLNYSTPISPALSGIFDRFTKRFPDIGLELHENTSDKQLELLYNNQLDLCFMWPTRDDISPTTSFIPLNRDTMHLVLRRDSALARKKNITAADLRGVPVFLSPRQMRRDFYDKFEAACRAAKFIPDVRSEIIQLPYIINMVAAGQGMAFLPEFLERIRPVGVKFRTCTFLPQTVLKMQLCLAYRTHDTSPLVQNLTEIARAFVADLT